MKSELKLGGERKKAAILFSDIRNFTAISENLNPEEVVGFLNEYMTMMVACVEESFGVVDKYIGDAVMAVWGTPVSKGNDTENAINGALLMRSALLEYNKGRGGPKKPVIRIGCGINTGSVLAGQIGSQNHMEYTVIGDAVNLASRVESLNKIFGTDILISEDSRNLVKNIFHLEPMRPITVKGKIQPQNIFAVIGRTDNPAHPQSLKEVRELLGILYVDLESVDSDAVELKYEL
jgi:adenylate cyclase